MKNSKNDLQYLRLHNSTDNQPITTYNTSIAPWRPDKLETYQNVKIATEENEIETDN